MQNPFDDKKFLGVVYNTSMNRPDAALALVTLYGFEGKRESRMGSICVAGAGLKAAIFCDVVGRVYMLGALRNSNSVLAVGLADVKPLPADPPMVGPAIEKRDENNEFRYVRSIRRVADTSLAEATLRNGVAFNSENVVILSAPATSLAMSLDLPGAREIYRERVKRLVIVDSGAPQQDVPALRRILAEWPTPIFFCGREVGEALPFPGARIESAFSWAPSHPVADAYRAYQTMPYDAPSYDLAAAHYAVHPDSGFFELSEPGSVVVSDDGRLRFDANAAGGVHSLIAVAAQKANAIQAFVEIVSAKPVPPPVRVRRKPDAAAADAAQQPPPPDPAAVSKSASQKPE